MSAFSPASGVARGVVRRRRTACRRRTAGLCLAFLAAATPGRAAAQSDWAERLERSIGIPAVSGHESALRDSIRAWLPRGVEARVDALGSLLVRFGRGEPEVLLACPLDEAGYVVSGITEDGYLRLRRVGAAPHPLFDQFLEGQRVVVWTSRGGVPGVVAVRSIHIQERRLADEPPFDLEDAYVDVGAEDAAEVRGLGIEPLTPATRWRITSRLANGQVAGGAAQSRAACLALVEAARRLAARPPRRGVVLVWAALERPGRQGINAVSAAFPDVREVYLIDKGFGFEGDGRRARFVGAPPPGSGVLLPAAAAWSPPAGTRTARATHAPPPAASYSGGPVWSERVRYVGLPVVYPHTPVETVSTADAQALAEFLEAAARGDAP